MMATHANSHVKVSSIDPDSIVYKQIAVSVYAVGESVKNFISPANPEVIFNNFFLANL